MTRNMRRYDYSSLYHVISRGNNKGQIFFHDDDRKKFCGLLKEMAAEYSFKIHLYCLMDNHFHLVIEEGPIPLKRIMQRLLCTYAIFINKKYNRVGHLFQGRFAPFIIQSEQYLLELCYYIHMNPIKAHMVDELDQYVWSSHLMYREKRKEDWVTTELVRAALLARLPEKEDRYEIFMSHYSEWRDENIGCLSLSDPIENNKRLHKRINSRERLVLNHLRLEEIGEIICKFLGVTIHQLRSASLNREIMFGRSMIGYFAHYHGMHYMKDIGAYLNRHPDSVGRAMRHALREIKKNREMKEKYLSLYRQLVGSVPTS